MAYKTLSHSVAFSMSLALHNKEKYRDILALLRHQTHLGSKKPIFKPQTGPVC